MCSHRSGEKNPFTFKKWPPDLRLNTPAIVNNLIGNSGSFFWLLCKLYVEHNLRLLYNGNCNGNY